MKRLLFFLLISSRSVFGQDVTGSWSGELAVQGTRLPLLFHIAKAGEGYSATLDSPRQGAKGIPIAEARFENGELQLSAPALLLKYTARFTGTDTLEGTFFQGGMSLPLTLHRGAEEPPPPRRPQMPEPPFNYYTEDVTLNNEQEGNVLAGTLAAPNENRDVQVTAKENLEGIRNSLERAGNKNVEVVEFPGLNHLFQTAQTGAVTEYGELEETIAPAVLEKMGSWILNLR